ncbi:MAG: glycosyltransferase family 4 protein [Candidatus Helarchaeota archaeon]|nr:glycosyltransferase family 4 protein [Candidatus Helarchaeota archaeon]
MMEDKFKVAFISTFWTRLGGGEIGANLLKKGLEKKKVIVKILTAQPIKEDEKDILPINFKVPIPKEIILLGNPVLDMLLKKNIETAFKKNNYYPNVIHVQNIYALPASVKVARKFKIPIVVTIREPLPKVLLHPYNFFIKFILNQILKSRNNILLKNLKEDCDKVIAVSDFIKDRMSRLGVPEEKLITIYNFPPKWEKLETIGNKFKSADISKKMRLLYLGRLEKAKGIHILLLALKKILSQISKIELIIAGEGPYERYLKELSQKLNLEKNVKFTGKIPFKKIGRLYISADIVCIPSVWPEPLSRVAYEAMSLEKPIITSAVGGMSEAIEDGKTGLVVPPNNHEELANALIKLIEDKELRENMGREGKKSIKQKFDLEMSVENHLNLYKKMAKNK